jgi:hypothetical protein
MRFLTLIRSAVIIAAVMAPYIAEAKTIVIYLAQ